MRQYHDQINLKYKNSSTGNVGAGKPVTVFKAGTTDKAALFNSALEEIANPVNADDIGNYTFNVENGTYDIYVDYNLPTQVSNLNVQIANIVDNPPLSPGDNVIAFDTLDDAINETNPLKIFNGAKLSFTERLSGVGGGSFLADVFNEDKYNQNDLDIVKTQGVGGLVIKIRIDDCVNPLHIGCIGDLNTDDTEGVNRVFDLAIELNLPICAWYEKKYKYTQDIRKTNISNLCIRGDSSFVGIDSGVYLSGSLVEIGQISEQSSKDNNYFFCNSGSSFNDGDLVVIWNSVESSYSNYRANYYDGEYTRVKSVSGNQVFTESPLLTSYDAAPTNKVYKMNGAKIDISGVSFVGGSLYALEIEYGEQLTINPKYVENKTPNKSGALALSNCFDVNIYKGRYFSNTGSSGNDYGIVISNSQKINIDYVESFGRRHPFTTGGGINDGAVPNRFITVRSSKLSNDPNADIYAADFHGNTIDSYFDDCQIYGSIGLAGENVACKGGNVHAWGNARAPLIYQEFVGGDLEFINVNTTTDDSNTSISVLNNASSTLTEKIQKPYRIFLTGGTYELTSSSVCLVNAFENSNQPNSWYIEDFGVKGDLDNYDSILNLNVLGGRSPARINVIKPRYTLPSNITPINASSADTTGTVMKQPSCVMEDTQGRVTKLEDGTMICQFTLSTTQAINTSFLGGFRTAGINWTFPKEFITPPEVSITPSGGNSFSATESSTSTTDCLFFLTAVTSQTSASLAARLTAVGRWF